MLRAGATAGYAAAWDSYPLPHTIEIDLGAPRIIDRIKVKWLDHLNRGLDYVVEGRLGVGAWSSIIEARDNEDVECNHTFSPRPTQRLRLTMTRCSGQQRMLLRHFGVYGIADVTETHELLAMGSLATEALGARIVKSTPFFDPPHDAEFLLRAGATAGYAAAWDSYPLPHTIEIDLGAPRIIDRIKIEWLDHLNRGLDYVVQGRLGVGAWSSIIEARDNEDVECNHTFSPRPTQRLRLTMTRCSGQQRMLLRHFGVYGIADVTQAGRSCVARV